MSKNVQNFVNNQVRDLVSLVVKTSSRKTKTKTETLSSKTETKTKTAVSRTYYTSLYIYITASRRPVLRC